MGDGGCEAPLAARGQDFPGGAVGKNPPAKAGGTGSAPDPGRPRTPQSNKARGPQLPSPLTHCRSPLPGTCAQRQRSPTARSPHPPQSERARAQRRRPSTAKEANLKINKRKGLGEKKNNRSPSLQMGGHHSLRRTQMTGPKARVQ